MKMYIYSLSNGEIFTVKNGEDTTPTVRKAMARARETGSRLYKRVIQIDDYALDGNLWWPVKREA